MIIPNIEKNTIGIYCIRNIVNGKVYIGSSQDIRRRILHHSCTLKNNQHSNIYLQQAYNKYGRENFEIILLHLLDNVEDLLLKEDFFIKFYNSANGNFGYNLVMRPYRPILSEETIKKIVSKNTGKKRSPETCKRISQSLIGRKMARDGVENMRKNRWSDENRKKQSEKIKNDKNAFGNKTQTIETRQKRAKSLIGKKHTSESIEKMKRNCRRGSNHHMFGKEFSDEQRKQMSDNFKGEKNPNYKKPLSQEQKIKYPQQKKKD